MRPRLQHTSPLASSMEPRVIVEEWKTRMSGKPWLRQVCWLDWPDERVQLVEIAGRPHNVHAHSSQDYAQLGKPTPVHRVRKKTAPCVAAHEPMWQVEKNSAAFDRQEQRREQGRHKQHQKWQTTSPTNRRTDG